MHELGITQNIMEIVEDEAGRAGLDRVTCVKLRIGRLTAIVPEALDFPKGCRFRTRCLEAKAVCRKEPELKKMKNNVKCACFFRK